MNHSMIADATGEAPRGGHGLAHVASARILVIAFAALIALTALTVTARYLDLDTLTQIAGLNFLVAMSIATVKAAIVALYFMHLRYDQPFNGLVFVIAVAFLALFLVTTLFDTLEYRPSVETYRQEMQQFAPPAAAPASPPAGEASPATREPVPGQSLQTP
jgi:cytochrome c oxidase subunit 4